jgi:hypothetical protein
MGLMMMGCPRCNTHIPNPDGSDVDFHRERCPNCLLLVQYNSSELPFKRQNGEMGEYKKIWLEVQEPMDAPRIEPRTYNGFDYVTDKDIIDFHGVEWHKKFAQFFGAGNTGLRVPAKEAQTQDDAFGIYYWDYERYADLVDYDAETYFD